jgi:hypothetical protein
MEEATMTPRPILIVGSGRSGTSVLTWALGQHPNIITTPETNWLSALASWSDGLYQLGNWVKPAGHLALWNVQQDAFLEQLGLASDMIVRNTFEARFPKRHLTLEDAWQQEDLAWFRSVHDPKTRWVDGTPSSSGFATILGRMFPDARFINLVRRPSDVVRSWLAFTGRDAGLAKAQSVVEHVYHGQRAGYLARAAFENRANSIIFENLVKHPEIEMRRILAFVDEEYTPACIEPILGKQINSSGDGRKAAAANELDTIAGSPLLASMETWYEAAQNPHWRIDSEENARSELTKYARYQIPVPKPV